MIKLFFERSKIGADFLSKQERIMARYLFFSRPFYVLYKLMQSI